MTLSRREALRMAAVFGAALVSSTSGEAQAPPPQGARTRPANEPFGYCLNTSTIRGNKLDIVGVVNGDGEDPRDGALGNGVALRVAVRGR